MSIASWIAPFDGPRFPVTSVRDNVEAVHHLLGKALGVHHLRAIVGLSMGCQQAFQWAVRYPNFADRIVVTSAGAKTWPHGIVRLESQIMAIENDPVSVRGNYKEQPPRKGLQIFGAIWAGWLFSPGWWREQLWPAEAPPGATFRAVFEGLYKDFVPGGDANDIILQIDTWEEHDVGGTRGFDGDVKKALASIEVPVLYMPSATDLYFPIDDARYEAQLIPFVTLLLIPSLWGHTAGAANKRVKSRALMAADGPISERQLSGAV